MMICGLELSGRRMLLLASMFCWVYGLFVYGDMLYGPQSKPSFGYQYYLISILPTLVFVGVAACCLGHPVIHQDTTPSIDVDGFIPEVFILKAIFVYAPLLLLALFPFLFILRVDETHPSTNALPFVIVYIENFGALLILFQDSQKNLYWLLLCVLVAFVCTPLTGFSPHHPHLLKLKLIMALLSVVIAFLCGVVYYSHLRSEARFLLQNRAGLRVPAAQAQPTNPAAKGDDQTKAIGNIV